MAARNAIGVGIGVAEYSDVIRAQRTRSTKRASLVVAEDVLWSAAGATIDVFRSCDHVKASHLLVKIEGPAVAFVDLPAH